MNYGMYPVVHASLYLLLVPFFASQGQFSSKSSQYRPSQVTSIWGGNPFEKEQTKYVAKVFEAVARAVKLLWHTTTNLCVQKDPKFLPPSPSYSPNSPPRLRKILESKSRLFFEQKPNFHRSLFFAKYGRIPVLVKFCESYGKAAHRLLAAAGLAPELRYCARIVGGAFMVIINLIDGPDARQEFKHGYFPADGVRGYPGRVKETTCSRTRLW
jgi:hypothetical protein